MPHHRWPAHVFPHPEIQLRVRDVLLPHAADSPPQAAGEAAPARWVRLALGARRTLRAGLTRLNRLGGPVSLWYRSSLFLCAADFLRTGCKMQYDGVAHSYPCLIGSQIRLRALRVPLVEPRNHATPLRTTGFCCNVWKPAIRGRWLRSSTATAAWLTPLRCEC